MTFENALAFLKTKRPAVMPNQGFLTQLRDYSTEVFSEEEVKISE